MAQRTVILGGACPDCRYTLFHVGPQGGCSFNIQCAQCKSTFCCPPLIAQRIPRNDAVYTIFSAPLASLFEPLLIDRQATEWLFARREPNFSTDQLAQLSAWLEADERHRAAFSSMERRCSAAIESGRKHAAEAARIVRITDERGEFIPLEDGYLRYAPSAEHGVLSAWELRVLADELDRRNKPHDDEITEYFVKHPQPDPEPLA